MKHHSDQEGGDEEESRGESCSGSDDAGTGTEAGQSPADSEGGGTGEEFDVDIAAGRNPEFDIKEGFMEPFLDLKGDGVDHDSAAHHEGEAGVPVAEDIEEAEDFLGASHFSDT